MVRTYDANCHFLSFDASNKQYLEVQYYCVDGKSTASKSVCICVMHRNLFFYKNATALGSDSDICGHGHGSWPIVVVD